VSPDEREEPREKAGEGDRSQDSEPHHALNNPVGEPDPTEWPDPYEERPDPRGDDHPPTGSGSTSEPHPERHPQPDTAKEYD
jgi:hypothetical protein